MHSLSNFLACRIQDANTMYTFKWNETSGQLHKRASGTWSTMGSSTGGIANGSTVMLRCDWSAITALDDGATRL